MKNRIIIHFYVKDEKKDKNGMAPIYLRITVNGKRAEISTNRRADPELWDKSFVRVAGRNEPARMINTVLNNLVSKVEKYFSSFDVRDEIISVDQIIAELKGSGRNQMTLIKAFEYHNNKLEELSGIEYAQSTINKYGYALNSIKKFLKTVDKNDIKLCVHLIKKCLLKLVENDLSNRYLSVIQMFNISPFKNH